MSGRDELAKAILSHSIGRDPRSNLYACSCGWQGTASTGGHVEGATHAADAVVAHLTSDITDEQIADVGAPIRALHVPLTIREGCEGCTHTDAERDALDDAAGAALGPFHGPIIGTFCGACTDDDLVEDWADDGDHFDRSGVPHPCATLAALDGSVTAVRSLLAQQAVTKDAEIERLRREATDAEDWQNQVALHLPEDYDDDVAQEAIIERFVEEMAALRQRILDLVPDPEFDLGWDERIEKFFTERDAAYERGRADLIAEATSDEAIERAARDVHERDRMDSITWEMLQPVERAYRVERARTTTLAALRVTE